MFDANYSAVFTVLISDNREGNDILFPTESDLINFNIINESYPEIFYAKEDLSSFSVDGILTVA